MRYAAKRPGIQQVGAGSRSDGHRAAKGMHGEMTGLEFVSVGLALLSAILGWTVIRQRREAVAVPEAAERPDAAGPDRVLLTTGVALDSAPPAPAACARWLPFDCLQSPSPPQLMIASAYPTHRSIE